MIDKPEEIEERDPYKQRLLDSAVYSISAAPLVGVMAMRTDCLETTIYLNREVASDLHAQLSDFLNGVAPELDEDGPTRN